MPPTYAIAGSGRRQPRQDREGVAADRAGQSGVFSNHDRPVGRRTDQLSDRVTFPTAGHAVAEKFKQKKMNFFAVSWKVRASRPTYAANPLQETTESEGEWTQNGSGSDAERSIK